MQSEAAEVYSTSCVTFVMNVATPQKLRDVAKINRMGYAGRRPCVMPSFRVTLKVSSGVGASLAAVRRPVVPLRELDSMATCVASVRAASWEHRATCHTSGTLVFQGASKVIATNELRFVFLFLRVFGRAGEIGSSMGQFNQLIGLTLGFLRTGPPKRFLASGRKRGFKAW